LDAVEMILKTVRSIRHCLRAPGAGTSFQDTCEDLAVE